MTAVAKPTLLIVQGIDQGMRFELGDQPAALGRGLQNEIRVHDTEVSRIHATVHRQKDSFVLTDRNSSNGTFVNGQLIRIHHLQHGDQIQIGRTQLLFATEDSVADANGVAERIDWLARHDPADQSSIVGRLNPDSAVGLSLATARSAEHLRVLYRISEEAVQASTSLDQLLQRILDVTLEAMAADRGCILLADPQTNELRPQVMSQRGPSDSTSRMIISRGIVDLVAKQGQAVQSSDAQHDARFDPNHSILQAGIREALCVPMQGRNRLQGVIYLDTLTTPDSKTQFQPRSQFSEEDLRLLAAIGRQAALAVENARFQQAIVQAERLAAVGQTIATLSHHIKNILQGVRGGSYLIDLGLKDHNEEMVRKGWQIVEKNQGKIYHLVLDMLTFSKERQPAWQRAQLNDTVHDVFELMQSRAEECRVLLTYTPDDQLPSSTFDPEGIHRAVLNIVTNAIDAVEGSDHAVVKIETGWERDTDRLWVAVTDNGPGIAVENLTRIFNLFESTKGSRGTGLGLAVSQKIIREHGGEIQVQSQLGDGARFILAWPRFEEEHHLAGRTQV